MNSNGFHEFKWILYEVLGNIYPNAFVPRNRIVYAFAHAQSCNIRGCENSKVPHANLYAVNGSTATGLLTNDAAIINYEKLKILKRS